MCVCVFVMYMYVHFSFHNLSSSVPSTVSVFVYIVCKYRVYNMYIHIAVKSKYNSIQWKLCIKDTFGITKKSVLIEEVSLF